MWNKPHLIALDEPTNYLDNETLSVLTASLKSFRGGVVTVSHNEDFVRELCSELWHVGGAASLGLGTTVPRSGSVVACDLDRSGGHSASSLDYRVDPSLGAELSRWAWRLTTSEKKRYRS